jgi:hypothetical protein
VHESVGENPAATDFKYRACIAWYGPYSTRTVSDDWGCPNNLSDPTDNVPDEILAAAKYEGVITLHADKSASDPTDDQWQPRSTLFQTAQGTCMDDAFYQAVVTQYDDAQMQRKYAFMSGGHPPKTHADEVGTGYADLWGNDAGGYEPSQSYGPYTLAVGDSVHIVVAEAVAGISREKNREVAKNWLLYENKLGTPILVRPNGSTTTDYNLYKDEWVWTCKDSLKETYSRILDAYKNNFDFPKPPAPPVSLNVASGGDRITLSWQEDPSAATDPHFDGYEVWRAKGIVDAPHAVWEKIFECNKSNKVATFDDTSAQRSVDYYYYVVSKSDGSDNTINPRTPLVSGKFYTMTNRPASLQRPAGTSLSQIRVVPNPYVISKQALQFGIETAYDRIAFYGLPPACKIKIYTERGDLINEINHTNGTGDATWESVTSSRQVIVSGLYIAYFEVTKDSPGFKKGQSTYRKFIVIR